MKHEEQTEKLIGIFYRVYNELGHGFLERMYQKIFAVVLTEKGWQFQEQMPVEVGLHEVSLGEFRVIWWRNSLYCLS